MKKLVVNSKEQQAHLFEEDTLIKSYLVSTAKNGLSCTPGSYCTPTGRLEVCSKIGEGAPTGAIFKARKLTPDIWSAQTSSLYENMDLVLTRILWLSGLDENNSNTKDRLIYLHGTNQEHLLGQPVSHGCVRFSNADIIDVYEQLSEGSEVIIL